MTCCSTSRAVAPGHSVRTTKEALSLASDDLDTATSLLTTRHLAGDTALTAELAALFEIGDSPTVVAWLAEHDLTGEEADRVLVRRVLDAQGNKMGESAAVLRVN